jgi:hypothetical protein
MSYRVCRKFTGSLFRVGDHLCKIFLEPMGEYRPGFYSWNVGFAVGKSRRQLNDWYRNRKNKRARSLKNRLSGKVGLSAISKGNDTVLKLRWNIEPGDCIVLDCTSKEPDKQFRAWKRWCRNKPEWVVDEDNKQFIWYRPPYPDDPLRSAFDLIGVVPDDPLICVSGRNYFKTFYFEPLSLYILLSNSQIKNQ